MAQHLDAHARPPDSVRDFYKIFQKKPLSDEARRLVVNFESAEANAKVTLVDVMHLEDLLRVFKQFHPDGDFLDLHASRNVYEHANLPGLRIVPSLIPAAVQLELLSRLLHRDLSNPDHLTNVHKFYHVPYPKDEDGQTISFFAMHPSSDPIFRPHDPAIHNPLSIPQFLNRKLRWATLGGQYDWTAKVYPDDKPPRFPADLAKLLKGLFPMEPEAAIVNLYTPGDTLSMHRDVAEFCDRGLISISIGCDAIFVVSLNGMTAGDGSVNDQRSGHTSVALRLRSGDAVYMSGPSRFAWHGVPQILADTCPPYLREWPAIGEDADRYRHWKGWMSTKRINLNVRQMYGDDTTRAITYSTAF